jgi:hypothetical protein
MFDPALGERAPLLDADQMAQLLGVGRGNDTATPPAGSTCWISTGNSSVSSPSSNASRNGRRLGYDRAPPTDLDPVRARKRYTRDLEKDALEGDSITEALRQSLGGKRRGIPFAARADRTRGAQVLGARRDVAEHGSPALS